MRTFESAGYFACKLLQSNLTLQFFKRNDLEGEKDEDCGLFVVSVM